MDAFFPFFSPAMLFGACCIAVCAGFVKGVVGFAMPLVLISGLTIFIEPELALAGLILPTLVTNLIQALRQGVGAALESVRRFRVFLIVGGIALVSAAQLVRYIPDRTFALAIGVPVVLFVTLQLVGFRLSLRSKSPVVETGVGAVAGVMGGIAGVWGPPTVMYLTALNTPKEDQMRIQGVIYGAGAIALVAAHLGSGVLRAETLPFSALLILPAMLGMYFGGQVSDRIDQVVFRRATLIVLLIVGINLIRRALMT